MSAPATSASTASVSDHARVSEDREAITYFNPLENREADQVPLQWSLVRRVYRYTRPYAWKRNWLLALTVARTAIAGAGVDDRLDHQRSDCG